MRNQFTDNRAADILHILGHKSGVTVADIAQKLSVSERTIRNDIRQLNDDLNGSAVVEGNQGRYSLRIFEPDQYKKAFDKICNIDGVFGTPRGRQNYVFGELMRADAPLLTDELAYEIAAGQYVVIDGEEYKITCVGYEAPITLKGLGHCTFNLSGATEAELPGTIYMESKPMPDIKIGTVIKIIEK